jgi:hypothetical protein
MRLPGGAARVSDQPARIADLAVTAASLYGLQMQSNQVGTDRSGEL